jgi:putative methionine-R-sulfoxide reductase with GAF domain
MREIDHPEMKVEERQKRRAKWASGIFALLSLAWLAFGAYFAIFQGWYGDFLQVTLLILAGALFLINLVSVFLIRRGQFALGTGLLYLLALVPPIIATLVIVDIAVFAIIYVGMISAFMIFGVLLQPHRRRAIFASALAGIAVITIEFMGPAFRQEVSNLPRFMTPIIIFITLGVSAVWVRRFMVSGRRIDLSFRSIAAQLNMVVIVAIGSLLFLGLVFVLNAIPLSNALTKINDIYTQGQAISDLLTLVNKTSSGLDRIVLEGDLSDAGETLGYTETMLSQFAEFKSTSEELGFRIEYGFAVENEPVFINIRDKSFEAISLARKNDFWQASQLKQDIDINIDHIILFSEDAAYIRQNTLADLLVEVNTLQQRNTIILFGLLVVGAVLVGVLTINTSRGITSRLSDLIQVAESLTAGDYQARARVTRQDEIGALATAYNTMAGELQATLNNLARRSLQIETSARVSRRLSTILDEAQLAVEVVDQVQTTFDYYHAHIYLFDDEKQNLIMMGGTGEAGRAMLERGHKIETGRGLVGRAGSTNQVVLVPDTSHEQGWLPNPLLPETKSEIAVPIATAGEVLGVLDVQQNAIGGLDESDVDLLRLIASQVAVALQNARAYQVSQNQAQREVMIAEISQRIQSTTDIDQALQVAVREMGRALGAQTSLKLKKTESGNGQE